MHRILNFVHDAEDLRKDGLLGFSSAIVTFPSDAIIGIGHMQKMMLEATILEISNNSVRAKESMFFRMLCTLFVLCIMGNNESNSVNAFFV